MFDEDKLELELEKDQLELDDNQEKDEHELDECLEKDDFVSNLMDINLEDLHSNLDCKQGGGRI